MRFIDDEERRARLGRRHLLSSEHLVSRPADVARSLTAIHGTDPTSTVLGIIARSKDASVSSVEHELYETRSIVRILGMRRTVFAVPFELAPAVWASFDSTVARNQNRLLARMLESTGIENAERWISEAEQRLLAKLAGHLGLTSTEIAGDDPFLSYRLPLLGPGETVSSQSTTSRLLTMMSAKGSVIRARPKGTWTSSQFTWATTETWRADWPERPDVDEADARIASSWLFGHGPATIDDLAWWTGWPKGRTRKAIEQAGGIEVETSEGPSFVLTSDLEPVLSPDPWITLLPGLDSSTMGWKRRGFYLGQHAERLFDNTGNGGPTVWVNGRIVGGWTQRETGEVVFAIFEDVGSEALAGIGQKATELGSILADVRIKPRARGYTASERSLI